MAKKKRVAKSKPSKKNDDEQIDFEDALEQVEEIVHQLESGEMGLTESLAQYEIGIKRLKQCHAMLQKAERKVTLLSGVDADGNSRTEPFDVEDEDDRPESQTTQIPRRGGSGTQASVDDLPGLF